MPTFTDNDVPSVLDCAIGSHAFKLDIAQYRRQTIPTLRQPQDNTTEPGEASLNTVGWWRRSQSDFTLGAGQHFFDDEESTRRSYWRSQGLDPWTPGRLRLLPDTERKRTSSSSYVEWLAAGVYAYIRDNTFVGWSVDPSGSSPTFNDSQIQAGEGVQPCTSICTDGNYVYAALGTNGIHRTALGTTTSTHFSAFQADLLRVANGRLLAASGVTLSEISGAGTATTIYTHPLTGWTWSDIAGTPNGIYAVGSSSDGTRSEVYFIGIVDASTGLSTPIYAGTLPIGEPGLALYYYGGVMLIGTGKGFRLANVSQGGGLTIGPLVPIQSSTGIGVQDFAAEGEYVWFTWSGFPNNDTLHPADTATMAGTGRMNLSEFTEPLVPAYAPDVMNVNATNTVTSVMRFGGRTYWTARTGQPGFYGEHVTNKVASGTLYSGWIRYGTVENKVVSNVDVRLEQPLPAGATVAVALHQEDGTVTTLGTLSTTSALSPTAPYDANLAVGEMFDLHITLTRATDTTTGPSLRRWTARSIATPARVDQIVAPLIFRREVKGGSDDGADVPINLLSEYQYLKGLEAAGTTTTFKSFEGTDSVRIESVQLVPDGKAGERFGSPFLEGLVVVTMTGLKKTS